jgi:hypothetical protein
MIMTTAAPLPTHKRPHSKARSAGYAIVYAGAGGVLLLLILALAQLRQLAADNARTLEVIEDCTTEGGTCYSESRRGTAEAIQVLNEFTTYVVACADRDGEQSAARIRACAIKEARKAQP